jgi:cupin 2 domain-containing protein
MNKENMDIFNSCIDNFTYEKPSGLIGERNVMLFENDKIKIEKIISEGFKSKKDFWYDQSESEYIYILQGIGILQFENKKKLKIKKSGSFLIEPHIKHRIYKTSKKPPCVWLCMFIKK